ncbi:MAG TPA: hypothetical protein VFN88_06275 [Caulobacteraceae bacterium]|nr:hypothetical protein [Caulobacteraceae bacterium]
MGAIHRFHAGDDPFDDPRDPLAFGRTPQVDDDLPYAIEIWDEFGEAVELVVAVARTPGTAYAAYYAAVREYHGREITLRHQGHVMSRWTRNAH